MGRGKRQPTKKSAAAVAEAEQPAQASRKATLDRGEYLRRAAAAEELLRRRERELGAEAKGGPKAKIAMLEAARERVEREGGGVSFYSGEGLRLACLRALVALPLAVEDVVLGVSACDWFAWSEEEIRSQAVDLLATHHYVTAIDFLGDDPPRHLLPQALLDAELDARQPQKARRRQSGLSA